MATITMKQNVMNALDQDKFAVVAGDDFTIDESLLSSMDELRDSWGNLEPDKYLKDTQSFRERRFGLFYFMPNTKKLIELPKEAYFQSAKTNDYAGGIQREFAPLLSSTYENPFLTALIKFNFSQFPIEDEMRDQPWKIDVHQFRIIGTKDETGEPTPEGIHHDDDEFNVIHLIKRDNVKGGINGVYDNDKNPIAKTTLSNIMDSVYVWDPHVMHGVSPIYPDDLSKTAIRDVLVIGYNFEPELKLPQASQD